MIKAVVAHCSAWGLANRIKCLVSAMRIADKLSCPLLLYWPKHRLVGCEFSDLFENEMEQIDEAMLQKFKQAHENYKIVFTWRLEMLPEDDLPLSFSKAFLPLNSRHIDLEYERIPSPVQESFIKYFHKLKPRRELINKAEKFASRFDSKTVGMQIRSWPAAPWRAPLFDLNSVFKIIERNKDKNFFISCDSEEVFQKILKEYNENILYFPKQTLTGEAESVEGMKEAFIDLLLLAKTNDLKVSYLSTFAEVGWWLGDCKASVEMIPPKFYLFKKVMISDEGDISGYCFMGKWFFRERKR